MNDNDIRDALKDALKKGQAAAEAGQVPGFDATFSAAQERLAVRRRHRRTAFGVAAAAAVVAVAAGLLFPQEPDWQYVDPELFATTTAWEAPSDVLLPDHRFDIYGQIPVLIESTGTDGGSLL